MPHVVRSCAVAVVFAFCTGAARADEFLTSDTGFTYTLSTDSIVEPNAVVAYQNLMIQNSLLLKNYGTISSRVFIGSGYQLSIINDGDVTGVINIGSNATLVQIVSDESDLHPVSVARADASAKFIEMADGAPNVNFMDLANLSRGADLLVLKDSCLNFNIGDQTDIPIELDGKVVFYINNASDLNRYVLLRNVSGDGTLSVVTGAPTLFYTDTAMDGTDVILNIRRETDYEKIIGGPKGAFINRIRASGIDSRLIASLDSAQSVNQLDAIMAGSVMLNPGNLMNPVRAMASSMMSDILSGAGAAAPAFAGVTGASGNAAALFGRDTFLYYGGVGAEAMRGDWRFGASVVAGGFSKNGLEDFGGKIYGGTISTAFNRKWLSARAIAGIGFVNFDTGPIYNGSGDAAYNPNGMIYYGAMDVGVRVYDSGTPADGEIYVVPFARANAMATKVLNDFDSEVATGVGGRVGYRAEMMGITTDYSAYGVLMTDGEQAGLRMDVSLPMDGASFGFRIGALNNTIGQFYEIGAEGNVKF